MDNGTPCPMPTKSLDDHDRNIYIYIYMYISTCSNNKKGPKYTKPCMRTCLRDMICMYVFLAPGLSSGQHWGHGQLHQDKLPAWFWHSPMTSQGPEPMLTPATGKAPHTFTHNQRCGIGTEIRICEPRKGKQERRRTTPTAQGKPG